jgi:hypothetical protein
MLQRPIIQILLSLSLSASLVRSQEQVQQPLNTTFDVNDCSKSKYYSPNYMAGTYSTTERVSLFYHACAHGDIEGDTSTCCSHSEDLGTCVLYVGGYPAYDCFFEEDGKGNSTERDFTDTGDNSPEEIESDDTDDDYLFGTMIFCSFGQATSTFTLFYALLLITAISVAVLLAKKRCTNQKGRVHVLDSNSIQAAIPVSAISSVDIQPVSYTKSHDTENELV